MRVLGISCDYHDAAAALVVDGELVAACEEERFSRTKHDSSMPSGAVASCLAIGRIGPDDLDAVVLHEKPLGVASRVLATRQRQGPRGVRAFTDEMPQLLRRNLFVGYRVEQLLRSLGATRVPPIRYGDHHLSHAAAAFLPSPFPSAAVLTVDGIGEWSTITIAHGTGRRIEVLAEQRYPNSLGLLYSLATTWCGFEANDGEYKLMGLAPFGEPRFRAELEELVAVGDDGVVRVEADRVGWWNVRGRTARALAERWGGPAREPGAPLTQRDADLARSVQEVVEDALLTLAGRARELTDEDHLCLAGGVALNCVGVGRVVREGPFADVWVQPAAGDAGSALGAALWWWHDVEGHRRDRSEPVVGALGADAMAATALGPSFDADDVSAWLEDEGVAHRRVPDVAERCAEVADRLAAGAVVGWFEGRMEFGPRALGHRSILADPRGADTQRDLNLRVKGRESFRPFAPAVRWEDAGDWFELDRPAPHMSVVVPVASQRLVDVEEEPEDFVARVNVVRSELPACTHIDGTARVQTVHREANPVFWELIGRFGERTGCPVLLNTSFNRAGEPIVCTPADALASARAAQLDLLVLEDCLVDVGASEGGPS